MVSLYSLIIFFFIMVILYSAMTLILSFSGWFLKKRASRRTKPAGEVFEAIDQRTDRLKSLAFNISLALVLFCITPFVIIYLFIL